MVTAVICYEDQYIKGFTVKGHAGFANPGSDIYCAGISAISQTALLGLIKHLPGQPEYQVKQGFLSVKLPSGLDHDSREKAQIILSTMEAGLKSLEESYPQYIKVETRRC